MRRLPIMVAILFLVAILAACGQSSDTYTIEEDGISITMTFKHKDDKITEQTMENVMPYEVMGLESKEQAEALFGMVMGEMEDIPGVKHDVKYKKNELVQTMVVDYKKASSGDAMDMGGMFFDADFDDSLSMSEMDEMLISQGFTKK